MMMIKMDIKVINKGQNNKGGGRGDDNGDPECPEKIVWVIEQRSGP